MALLHRNMETTIGQEWKPQVNVENIKKYQLYYIEKNDTEILKEPNQHEHGIE